MTRTKQKSDLLIQVHSLIVLFIGWSVRADRVIESNDEVKSLTSYVNGLEGEPLHSSALPKDISSLNVARQQELAEPLFKFRRLELQKNKMIKTMI